MTQSGVHPNIALHFSLDPRINFVMQQNDVPVVKRLAIENRSGSALRNLQVRIKAEPEFAIDWTARIDHIGETATYNLDKVDLVLSPGFLGDVTERLAGLLHVEVFQEKELLLKETKPAILLPREEWGGLSSLPEILAAFVTPNHPAIEQVLRDAAVILEVWTQNPSLSGYQVRDSKRTFLMTAAIYTAIRNLSLTYINPPASFETEGQRIRLPDRILGAKMATCLDLAVFTASCLEQAGLNPLVLIVKGHAFAGVWLKDECFQEPATDEPLRIRKRVDLNEICVFDPTCATTRPPPGFNIAVQEGKHRLDNPADFLCAIDIRRARHGRIRPLPELVPRKDAVLPAYAPTTTIDDEVPCIPDLGDEPESKPTTVSEPPETPVARLERWRRKLLDLSLRNRLINFRDTKKTIPLFCPNLHALEDALAERESFRILPRPADFGEADPRSREAHRRRTGDEALEELLEEELAQRRLRANLTSDELERRLVEIYRAARLGMEEGGASALYLAIGFLVWYESPSSEERRMGPILLLPLELSRNSVREGFSLKLGDEEPRVNVTLLEMLKLDFALEIPGLDPLPEDHSGIDVPRILQLVRRAVRDIDRWEVEETARIGLLSFTKFLMWRDLTDRAQDLLKNVVVYHLVHKPNQAFDEGGVFPDPASLDKERPATKTYCPLPTDSSQLAAVFAAADGKNFVLEGPPGTGKSQTITNLIAHCLAIGKTVLFASEKMAALSVVHERLKRVGLDRYCLELHSNKTHKKAVIARLEESLQRMERFSLDEWEREAHRLEELRAELNDYVQALHRRRASGETVFQAISRLIGLRNVPRVNLQWPSPDDIDPNRLEAMRELVARMAVTVKECGNIADHPWRAIRRGHWTPAWEDEALLSADRLDETLRSLDDHTSDITALFQLGPGGGSYEDLELLHEITGTFLNPPSPPAPILLRPDWDEINTQIGTWIERGRHRDALRSEIYPNYSEKILDLDFENYFGLLRQAEKDWAPVAWFRRRPIKKALRKLSRHSTTPADTDLDGILSRAKELREEQGRLESAGEEARALLGRYWKNGEAEWDGIESFREWARHFRSLALKAAKGDASKAAALREAWAPLVTEARELLDQSGNVGKRLIGYRRAFEAVREARNAVENLLDADPILAWGSSSEADAISRVRGTVDTWEGTREDLRSWCAWRRIRSDVLEVNLGPLVWALEEGRIESSQLRTVFDRSYYRWWFAAIVEKEPALSHFSSPGHEHKIHRFREIDERYTRLTQALIQARLGSKVPDAGPAIVPSSEMGTLMREIGKRSRFLAIRRLFQKIPNLLPRIKPCLLMSPMSVAQYLDASFPPFDLVVFDEASQIPVWDAVGAIARGKQVVVVGDPKQLPPTSFFERMEDDDAPDETDTVEDLESILDECIGAQIPCLRLLWHYRSRHESLIAFSNYHYYDNRLLTFPSPKVRDMGVSWRHVPHGIYDKGKSRTNRAEAEAVVKEIVSRLKDPGLSKLSIGVVTFSLPQQMLIEDLLDQVRRDDVELDQYFREDLNEPVFVKNLENVQGDERDVILFSICFGPDLSSRVSMNFGPMNRDGGERRLNVAITRARREVVVFSTLQADQIDLSRTRAKGVYDLKSFLEYARLGPSALAGLKSYDPNAEFDSPFEKEVRDAVVAFGWQVHLQVGCSGYRIDLAVVDPDAPGSYLLGIECDGANYHRAKTARDRDRIREFVLRSLGWELHRVWSTDWWANPQREITKIKAALDRAKKLRVQRKEEDSSRRYNGPVSLEEGAGLIASAPTSVLPALKRRDEIPEPDMHEKYEPLVVEKPIEDSYDFYSERAPGRIRKTIAEVVEKEAPISLALVTRRVTAFWGFSRITAKAVKRVLAHVPQDKVRIQKIAGDIFLWRVGQEPREYESFRVPGSHADSHRSADDIPIEEIANAAMHILRRQISLPIADLARETGRLFGFERMGNHVLETMMRGLVLLTKKGSARIDSEMISVT